MNSGGPRVTRRTALRRSAGYWRTAGAGVLLAACAQTTSAPDKLQAVRGPVEVTFWDWFPDRTAYWEDQFRLITHQHPQIKFSLTLTGNTGDQLEKVKAALAGGAAPEAMFLHHSMFLDLATMGGLQPLAPAKLPFKPFETEWTGFKEKHFHWEGKPLWAAMGLMVPCLFINTDMWQAAGLGDKDIPATWEQLHEVARKLSKRGPDGKLAPAGLAASAGDVASWMDAMRYQKGLWHFSKDGKKSLQNHPENVRSLEFLLRLWNDAIWPERREIAAFMRREAAIGFRFNWYANTLRLNAPDLSFRLVPLPTVSGKDTPARHIRVYDPASPVIFSTTQGDKLDAAWLLVRQILADEDANAELVRQHSSTPNWHRLQQHRLLKDDAGVQTVSKVMPYTVLPGWLNLQSGVENPANLADVFAKGASPKEMLDRVAEQETLGLSRNVNVVTERQYAHAGLLKE
jgi:multiple sugar transport system substrate-binding protein